MRFTIREILLITLIVALGLGWWVDHRRIAGVVEKNKMLRDALQSTLNSFQRITGDNLGIQLPDGEFFHSGKPDGVVLEGRG